jgi:DNA-binding transcriptional LysR family regulator
VTSQNAHAWFGIELRHLAALREVARDGSFRRASEHLGYAQSTISQQIAALESLTGCRLVNRTRGTRPVELTAAGGVLLEHAERIIERIDAARADVAAVEDGCARPVAIGVIESVATRLVPALLRRIAADGSSLRLHEECHEAAELVAAGGLDLAFCELPLPPGAFAWRVLFRDPLVLAVPRSLPLAGKAEALAPSDLAEVPLITQTTRSQCVETQLHALGIDPNVVVRADREQTVVALVREGVGTAVLPRSVVEAEPTVAMCALPAELALAPRTVAVFWNDRPSLAPEVECLIEAAVEAAAECGFVFPDHRDGEVSLSDSAR